MKGWQAHSPAVSFHNNVHLLTEMNIRPAGEGKMFKVPQGRAMKDESGVERHTSAFL